MASVNKQAMTWQRSLVLIAVAAIVYIGQQMGCIAPDSSTSNAPTATPAEKRAGTNPTSSPAPSFPTSPTLSSDGEAEIAAAAKSGKSDFMVKTAAVVERILADDNEGSRHQKFIVRLRNRHTLLVAHNIDIADRVPVKEGDDVILYGEYEWSDRGGVLHWTHHDPGGRHEGGYIELRGKRYD